MLTTKQIYIWGCLSRFAKIIWGYIENPKSFQREVIYKGAENWIAADLQSNTGI